jgi:hypothetical protein
MKRSTGSWFELGTALFVYAQQQSERYLLNLGQDAQYLKDVNRDVFTRIIETLEEHLDEDRARFLDSMLRRFAKTPIATEEKARSRMWAPTEDGFAEMMRRLYRSAVARGRLEMEIYDAMAELWDGITAITRESRDIESIDPKTVDDVLEQFNQDIRAILVLHRESVLHQDPLEQAWESDAVDAEQ